MTAVESTIVHRAGTYRTRTPEETWQRVSPMLPTFGITRVADITRLDEIGFPVHVAYRPVGTTLAVSVGTGLTAMQSRVSAVMESIETWHAENPRLEIADRSPAAGLPLLHYDLSQLNLAPRSPLGSTVVLDWVAGTGLLTGRPCLAPFDMILLNSVAQSPWATALFRPTSNGLASGNTPAEATLHALLEAIERDCLADDAATEPARRCLVDPATAADPGTRHVVDTLVAAGFRLRVYDVTNDLGVPCYHAVVWAADVPAYFVGFGCHLDGGIALGRALLEAAQARLVAISGARDDVDMELYQSMDPMRQPPPDGDLPRASARPPIAPPGGVEEAVRVCAERVMRRTGVEPFVVDMTRADVGIPVSKVFAPGLELIDEHAMTWLRW
jgi:ribosomal protein S12 methylthiotransferase accessory factor